MCDVPPMYIAGPYVALPPSRTSRRMVTAALLSPSKIPWPAPTMMISSAPSMVVPSPRDGSDDDSSIRPDTENVIVSLAAPAGHSPATPPLAPLVRAAEIASRRLQAPSLPLATSPSVDKIGRAHV